MAGKVGEYREESPMKELVNALQSGIDNLTKGSENILKSAKVKTGSKLLRKLWKISGVQVFG